jgi:ketosteroid isomerase-like protein
MPATGPNEQVIRDGFRAFSEERFDDCLATLDPEVEWHIAFQLPDLPPERRIVHGHDEVLELWEQFAGVWERLVFEPERILYDEGETAIVRIRVQGIGSGSRIEVDRTIFYAMTIRDRKLLRILPFDTPEEAAAAVGVDVTELG